jgi:spore germination protein KA
MVFRNEWAASQEQDLDRLSDRYDSNLEQFRKLLGKSPDITIRQFVFNTEKNWTAAIIFLENMADKDLIKESILNPLKANAIEIAAKESGPRQFANIIKSQLATVCAVKVDLSFKGASESIWAGDTVLIMDGLNEALIFRTRHLIHREIGIPETEITIRGPRESFVEALDTNITLLRRRISHSELTLEVYKAGRKTNTNIGVLYLKGVVNEKIVAEVGKRISRIQIDGILGAGYIEQLIGDAPFSPFSTVSYSERPDVVAGKILEGRVAILIDGTPEVLTVPALFIESFQNPDDYNSNPYYATLIRWIRYIAFGISLLGPAVYIALASYNQELIPTPLFINMAAGAAGTPYPVIIEVIIIGLLFEIFREAGVRLPKPFGQGITFVVALVLAQASVAMGLTGVTTVVVVTITAIASFVIPNQANASILIRLTLAILASVFGAYGILLGFLWVLAHLASLRSLGVPYLAPIAPFNPQGYQQDVIFKTPLWASFLRPRVIGWHNPRRLEDKMAPAPPTNKDGQDH